MKNSEMHNDEENKCHCSETAVAPLVKFSPPAEPLGRVPWGQCSRPNQALVPLGSAGFMGPDPESFHQRAQQPLHRDLVLFTESTPLCHSLDLYHSPGQCFLSLSASTSLLVQPLPLHKHQLFTNSLTSVSSLDCSSVP